RQRARQNGLTADSDTRLVAATHAPGKAASKHEPEDRHALHWRGSGERARDFSIAARSSCSIRSGSAIATKPSRCSIPRLYALRTGSWNRTSPKPPKDWRVSINGTWASGTLVRRGSSPEMSMMARWSVRMYVVRRARQKYQSGESTMHAPTRTKGRPNIQ